jgi:signal transduction histidine kinase
MQLSFDHRFLLRFGGYTVVAMAWVAYIIGKLVSDEDPPPALLVLTNLCFVTFCAAFWLTSEEALARTRRNAALLGVQSALILLAVWQKAGYPIYLLCLVVVWQITLAYGWAIAAAFCAVKSLLLLLAFAAGLPWAEAARITAFALGFQVFAIGMAQAARAEAEGRARLAKANEELRAMQARLADSILQAERGRIARDLHDTVGHGLAALSLQLEVASHVTAGQGHYHVLQAKSVAASLLEDIRKAIGLVRAEQIVDLGAALQKLTQMVGKTMVAVSVEPDVRQDDPALNMVIFRIVQEAITNTLRHAEAEELRVSVANDDGMVVVEARDNGRGRADFKLGYGLTGMRERVQSWGGNVFLWSQPGAGFRVRAILPYALS